MAEPAFVLCASAFVLAAAVIGLVNARTPITHGLWLATYLALVGGMAQILLGSGLFILMRHADVAQPGLRHATAELVLWNAGTVAVAVADLAGSPRGVLAGSVLLAVALALFFGEIRRIDAAARRPAPVWRLMYVLLLVFLGVSVVVGTVLAYRGRP